MSDQQSVIIKVGNVNSRIFGFVSPQVMVSLDDALKFRRRGIEHSDIVISGKWDGYTPLFNARLKSFPSGLMRWVLDVLDLYEYEYEIDDTRNRPARNRDWHIEFDKAGMDYYDFQRETIDVAQRMGRGVFAIPTGGGKTLTFTGIIGELGLAPAIVYVPSLLLLEQTRDEIREYLRDAKGNPVDVGMVGNGKCDIRDVTVMTVQTAITACDYVVNRSKGTVRKLKQGERAKVLGKSKRKHYEDPDADEDLEFVVTKKTQILDLIQNAKAIFVDEGHRSSSAIYQAVLRESMSAFYRMAFSATAYREDNTEMLMYGCFGRKLIDINCSELIRRGILVRPYIFSVPTPMVEGEFSSYDEAHRQCIVHNEARNQLFANIAQRLQPLGPTLMLVKEIPHGKALQAMLPDTGLFISGKDSKSKKDKAIADLLSGKLPQLIATPICDEGLNLKPLRSLILCDPGKSATKLYQRVGRTLRVNPGKDNSVIIDPRDSEPSLAKHATERNKLYLAEDEFVKVNVSQDGWKALQGLRKR